MEKIKTVGDAYMAASGAPKPREDHAVAAAEMSLRILAVLRGAEWPTGDEIWFGSGSRPAPPWPG